jgi:hypothetical protein
MGVESVGEAVEAGYGSHCPHQPVACFSSVRFSQPGVLALHCASRHADLTLDMPQGVLVTCAYPRGERAGARSNAGADGGGVEATRQQSHG